MKIRLNVILIFLTALLLPFAARAQANKTQDKPFVVVIDAGHGGHDPGALGARGQEKAINLAIALELGKKIEATCPDVKVYYTRKTDVFVTLQGRADFVNKHKADLFICVHTNSAKSASAHGVETFTLGLNKSQSNLDVAMRENSVMLLEEDYKTKYQGFNPNSVESYIMFEFMQDQYVDRSLQFASLVQNQFVSKAKRYDRGVRQAAFWVLHKSACPSVLIEVGFITNAEEEKFLLSQSGRETMANAIYNAFVDYKRSVQRKTAPKGQEQTQDFKAESKLSKDPKTEQDGSANADDSPEPAKADTTAVKQTPKQNDKDKVGAPEPDKADTAAVKQPAQQNVEADVVYKIQYLSSPTPLKKNAPELKGLPDTYYKENGVYKYTTGATDDWEQIVKLNKEVRAKFHDAFIIAFIKGKKVTVAEARLYQQSR